MLITVFSMLSAPLSVEQAKGRIQQAEGGSRYAAAPLEFAYAGTETATPAYYAFNTPQGFVIASADDVAAPVLGYNDSGSFNYASLPPQMKWWLEGYARQIDEARKAPVKTVAMARPQRDFIAPLVLTLWNQSAPYNAQCPVYNTKTAPTGCVATAMAQLLRFWKAPAKGTGSHSYVYKDITNSFDFGATTFAWSQMTHRYTSASTEKEKNAVATLMRACGVSVNMMYNESSSGAYSRDVLPALVTYFSYSPSSRHLDRNTFTLYEWEDQVYGSLKRGHPVYYSGSGDGGGHAFVVDGYQGNGYFHLNWGWGGSSDGYFLLTALDPGSLGIGGGSGGFNRGQTAILDLQPKFAGEKPFRGVDYNSGYTLALSGTRLTLTGFGGSIASTVIPRVSYMFRYVGDNGKTYTSASSTTTSLKPAYGFRSQTTTLPSTMADGVYSIIPYNIFQEEDGSTSEADAYVLSTVRNKYKLRVSNGTKTLINGSAANISVTELAALTPAFVGGTCAVKGKYVNSSSEEYYDDVYIGWFNSNETMTSISEKMTVDVPANETQDMEMVTDVPTSLTAGTTYKIAFVRETADGYERLSPFATVTAETNQTTMKMTAKNLVVANSTAVDATNITFSLDVTATSGYYMKPIWFWAREGSTALYSGSTPAIILAPGETKHITCSFPFMAAEKDKEYTLLLNYKPANGNAFLASTTFTVTTTGIKMLTGDEFSVMLTGDEAVATCPETITGMEVYDMRGMRVNTGVRIDGTTAVADMSHSQPGIYVVRVLTATQAYTQRIMIR